MNASAKSIADRTPPPVTVTVTKTKAEASTPPAPASPSSWDAHVQPVPAEWFTTAAPARQWLLRDGRRPDKPGLLPQGKAGSLVAAGGVGKTSALVQLALAVASGTRWLDVIDVAAPGRVLLALGEEDADEIHRKVFNGSRGMAIPAPGSIVTLPLAGIPCALLERGEHGNPLETDFARWLLAFVKAHGPWRLIVLDPLSRFAGLDAESDNAQATRFVQAIEALSSTSGATTLVSHHTNKASRGNGVKVTAEGSRGATAIVDGFRWQATLASETVDKLGDTDLDEIVTLSFTKSNYSRRAGSILLRRDDHGSLHALDPVERELVDRALDGSIDREARQAEREAARAQRQAAREAEREANEAASTAREAAKRVAEDQALRESVAEEPGIREAALISAMRARLGKCSDGAARAAISRALIAKWLDVRPGSKNAKEHFLKEDA